MNQDTILRWTAYIIGFLLGLILFYGWYNHVLDSSEPSFHYASSAEIQYYINYYNASCGCIHCALDYCLKYQKEINISVRCD